MSDSQVWVLEQRFDWSYFFENGTGIIVTVNRERYCAIISEFFWRLKNWNGEGIEHGHFMVATRRGNMPYLQIHNRPSEEKVSEQINFRI